MTENILSVFGPGVESKIPISALDSQSTFFGMLDTEFPDAPRGLYFVEAGKPDRPDHAPLVVLVQRVSTGPWKLVGVGKEMEHPEWLVDVGNTMLHVAVAAARRWLDRFEISELEVIEHPDFLLVECSGRLENTLFIASELDFHGPMRMAYKWHPYSNDFTFVACTANERSQFRDSVLAHIGERGIPLVRSGSPIRTLVRTPPGALIAPKGDAHKLVTSIAARIAATCGVAPRFDWFIGRDEPYGLEMATVVASGANGRFGIHVRLGQEPINQRARDYEDWQYLSLADASDMFAILEEIVRITNGTVKLTRQFLVINS